MTKKQTFRQKPGTPDLQARLTVVIDAERKQQFDAAARELGSNASEVLRRLIENYVSAVSNGQDRGSTTAPTTGSAKSRR